MAEIALDKSQTTSDRISAGKVLVGRMYPALSAVQLDHMAGPGEESTLVVQRPVIEGQVVTTNHGGQGHHGEGETANLVDATLDAELAADP